MTVPTAKASASEVATATEARRAHQRRYRWARKYRPESIDLLLLAEAPPAALDRYFYFPEVSAHDSLFRETARVILKREPTRSNKAELLGALRDRYVFMLDACLDPLKGDLRIDTSRLVARIRVLGPRRIIIVKAGVFDQTFTTLTAAGLPVINARVPFPGSGQQVRFRDTMRRALRRRPPAGTPVTKSR